MALPLRQRACSSAVLSRHDQPLWYLHQYRRRNSTIQSRRAFLSHNLPKTINHASVALAIFRNAMLQLYSRLDYIERVPSYILSFVSSFGCSNQDLTSLESEAHQHHK